MTPGIIEKALCLSLVSDAFSPNRKTLFSLRKTIGKIEWKMYVFENDEKALRKSLFLQCKITLGKPYKTCRLRRLLDAICEK